MTSNRKLSLKCMHTSVMLSHVRFVEPLYSRYRTFPSTTKISLVLPPMVIPPPSLMPGNHSSVLHLYKPVISRMSCKCNQGMGDFFTQMSSLKSMQVVACISDLSFLLLRSVPPCRCVTLCSPIAENVSCFQFSGYDK